MRVTHVITGLGNGGAEHMLARLVASMPAPEFRHEVITLGDDGPVGDLLRASGCAVHVAGLRHAAGAWPAWRRLCRMLERSEPDLVQTWLCHADLLGGLAARRRRDLPVVWGVHQADEPAAGGKSSTRMVRRICARLADRLPARVVSASAAGAALLRAAGYPAGRIVVIPNGVDPVRFRPDAEARAAFRRELGVDDDTLLIGLVARWHADKDHANFLAAAARLAMSTARTRFVLVGAGIDAGNAALADLVARHGVGARCDLLGQRGDLPRILAGLDMLAVSSRTEAFPNVVIEAMASALPVVATAVGDIALMLGDCGAVVPPADPAALSAALLEQCEETAAGRAARGASARERVLGHYTLARAAARYGALYRELAR